MAYGEAFSMKMLRKHFKTLTDDEVKELQVMIDTRADSEPEKIKQELARIGCTNITISGICVYGHYPTSLKGVFNQGFSTVSKMLGKKNVAITNSKIIDHVENFDDVEKWFKTTGLEIENKIAEMKSRLPFNEHLSIRYTADGFGLVPSERPLTQSNNLSQTLRIPRHRNVRRNYTEFLTNVDENFCIKPTISTVVMLINLIKHPSRDNGCVEWADDIVNPNANIAILINDKFNRQTISDISTFWDGQIVEAKTKDVITIECNGKMEYHEDVKCLMSYHRPPPHNRTQVCYIQDPSKYDPAFTVYQPIIFKATEEYYQKLIKLVKKRST